MYPSFQRTICVAWSVKVAILTILSICVPAQIHAQGTYPKIEASFTVNTPIADPFDYSNDVRVLMVQPDASTISLPAFFDGGTTWRVRHTPTMAGALQHQQHHAERFAAVVQQFVAGFLDGDRFSDQPGFCARGPRQPAPLHHQQWPAVFSGRTGCRLGLQQ